MSIWRKKTMSYLDEPDIRSQDLGWLPKLRKITRNFRAWFKSVQCREFITSSSSRLKVEETLYIKKPRKSVHIHPALGEEFYAWLVKSRHKNTRDQKDAASCAPSKKRACVAVDQQSTKKHKDVSDSNVNIDVELDAAAPNKGNLHSIHWSENTNIIHQLECAKLENAKLSQDFKDHIHLLNKEHHDSTRLLQTQHKTEKSDLVLDNENLSHALLGKENESARLKQEIAALSLRLDRVMLNNAFLLKKISDLRAERNLASQKTSLLRKRLEIHLVSSVLVTSGVFDIHNRRFYLRV
jgi:hypothetical protein